MKIIECPRDAMQGLTGFISTSKKIEYLVQLLKVGFDSIDFGSFVSSTAIPQMRDSGQVLSGIDMTGYSTKLLAIVANVRGAQYACNYDAITYIGYPLSVSETFQKRNTNKSIADSLNILDEIKGLCDVKNKILVTYISMGFGNPYNDPYNEETVLRFVDILGTLGVKIISLADTIGMAAPIQINRLLTALIREYPSIEFGAHLHSGPLNILDKLEAAYSSGCQRIDGALLGFGGCPMAKDQLVGNIPTEQIISFLHSKSIHLSLNMVELERAIFKAREVFYGN